MSSVVLLSGDPHGRSEIALKTLRAKLSYWWLGDELLEVESIGTSCRLAITALASMPSVRTRRGPIRLNLIAPPLAPLDELSAKSIAKSIRTSIYVGDRDPAVNYHDTNFIRTAEALGARVFYAEDANREALISRTALRKRLTRAPLPHAQPEFRSSEKTSAATVVPLTRRAS